MGLVLYAVWLNLQSYSPYASRRKFLNAYERKCERKERKWEFGNFPVLDSLALVAGNKHATHLE